MNLLGCIYSYIHVHIYNHIYLVTKTIEKEAKNLRGIMEDGGKEVGMWEGLDEKDTGGIEERKWKGEIM